MKYEPGESNRLLVNVPPEHAKSTVITVNYSTYRIALNPNIRIIVVSKTLNKAREFVYAIKQRLSHPRWLKLQTAYGPDGGWKGDADTWRTDTVYLGGDARNSSEKDPTLQALGMGGQIYGARADLIILDDCITTANAHEWEQQINWLQKEVITRLGKNGKLLVVGTRIAANDLYKELRNPKHWSGGHTPFTYMGMPAVLEYAEEPKDWTTLWAESDVPWDGDTDTPKENGFFPKWDGEALFKRRSEVTPSTWALVYQQEDIQEDSIFPPALVAGSTNGARKKGILQRGAVGHPTQIETHTVIGFDPAMGDKAHAGFVVVAYNRADGKIYVLDCVNMSEPTPQKIRATIEELVQKYKPQELRVEINAHQKAYSLDDELRNWLASYGVRLDAHFTGKNKWDTSFGVASMSTLFGTMREEKFQRNNIIELPSSENSEGIKALTQQLLTWKPDTRGKTDCVMALWFAIIRCRELMQSANRGASHAYNRWATRAQKDRRGSVNLDEAFAEQWQETYG
jgi:spermidine/putrescine-binding protein